MIDGSAPSVNSRQTGHCKSPKYWSVTGAEALPSVSPLWGIPPIRVLTSLTIFVAVGVPAVTAFLLLPPPEAIKALENLYPPIAII